MQNDASTCCAIAGNPGRSTATNKRRERTLRIRPAYRTAGPMSPDLSASTEDVQMRIDLYRYASNLEFVCQQLRWALCRRGRLTPCCKTRMRGRHQPAALVRGVQRTMPCLRSLKLRLWSHRNPKRISEGTSYSHLEKSLAYASGYDYARVL